MKGLYIAVNEIQQYPLVTQLSMFKMNLKRTKFD